MSVSVGIGLVVLLAVISLLMAIAWAAQKGGPLIGPVALILLAIAFIIGHAGVFAR